MTISVVLDGDSIPIDRDVFVELLENSVASDYVAYQNALAKGSIEFKTLVRLARKGEIPYSLFFGPVAVVRAQIRANTGKLLEGISKATFSVNSRGTVELHRIELIVKDLLRKQATLKKYDDTLTHNTIVGMIGKPGTTVEQDAQALMRAIKLTRSDLQSARNKEAALNLLIDRLESSQILVSRSVRNYMPQQLKANFSGMAIKDKKVPYIFLASELGQEELYGRQVFTLTLLTVLIARNIFAPVTYQTQSGGAAPGREYEIVEQLLMPVEEIITLPLGSLDDIVAAADHFKVTPSALAVRAMHLKLVDVETSSAYLTELNRRHASRPKSQARNPLPAKAVRKYAGRELVSRMFDALDAGRLSERQFCKSVCLNKLKPTQLADLRAVVG
ncbi:hypothetical protein [Williamsia maris]|uniref:Uncharacterized protein n=1 Tax=Williamsia maris TaxID=72806 RepID=A0ABT1HJL6_9NOCA|nr:hypothetical protein [Williamsia maris]MCP2178122.1 hypothetical protein [Williamsia maris]